MTANPRKDHHTIAILDCRPVVAVDIIVAKELIHRNQSARRPYGFHNNRPLAPGRFTFAPESWNKGPGAHPQLPPPTRLKKKR